MIGFFYHTISEETLPHIKHLYPYKTPSDFEEDIKYLKQYYDLPPIEELFDSLSNPKRDKRPAVFISFDDGLKECFDNALTILQKHQVQGIFFIATGFVDNQYMCYRHKVSLCIESLKRVGLIKRRQILDALSETCKQRFSDEHEFVMRIRGISFADEEMLDMICKVCEVDTAAFLDEHKPYMTKEQIRTLVNEGHIIGAHSVHHSYLGHLTDVDQIEAEIVDSCKYVAEITQTDCVPFAFPFSGRNLDDALIESIIERYPIVGNVFDSTGLHQDKSFIHNRICADRPPSVVGTSNIPLLIEEAYRTELNQRLRKR